MPNGLARAALRGHRPAFAGTAVAALFAATVVSASITMMAATGADGLSPAARAALDSNGVGSMAVVMLIGSVYLSIFVIVSTMGTAVAQQHREFAMLRAIGARPRQLRRAVAVQALAAAVPSAAAGFGLGVLVARWWFAALAGHGLIPAEVRFRFTLLALPACLGVAAVTSALAGMGAAARFTWLRPARALAEAATGRRGLGLVRTPLGVLALAGGATLSAVVSTLPAEKAGQSAFLVLILFCAGVGLLGPRIVGPAAWLAARVTRPFGSSAELAMVNVTSQPRRFAAAVVPLTLVVGFGVTKIAVHTTAAYRTGSAGAPGELWLDYIGTGLYAAFAAIAAANTLAMITYERRRDLALLRVVGTAPGQLRTMAAWEALVVALTALLLGTAVALLTLAPILRTAYGSALPHLPWPIAAAIACGTLALTLLSTGIPVLTSLRRRAITAL
ncbi:ABC transporter permease [Streptomyces varsoviensis]|nr:ABC transporter permease [Streptomyces varsoviensis]